MSSSCVGVTEAGAVFAFPVSIADKLLSAVFTGQTVIGFPTHLFRMGIPPCISASVGTKVFGLSALHLEYRFPTPAASDPNRIFRRVAADVGADGIDGDLKGKRNIRGCFAPAAHDVQNLNFVFGHFVISLFDSGVIPLLISPFLCVRPRAVARREKAQRLRPPLPPLGATGKTDGSRIQYGRICYIDLRRTAANAGKRFLGLDGNVAILA